MQSSHQIAITSPAGEPKDPRTWSGTPSNIAKELESLGIEVFGISSELKKYQKLTYRLIHQLSGLGSAQSRGRLARTHSGNIVQSKSKDFNCHKILHTGTLDIPLSKTDADFEHYLFCDTTWNLWTQYATNIDCYPPKAIQLSEELEEKSYAQVKHFFATSEYVRQNLINRYQIDSEKITVVGTGRGKIKPSIEPEKSEQQILFVAKERFEDKGGFLLLEGFKLAVQKNPSLKLIVVGQEKYQEFVGSIPNIIVKGFIPWNELQDLFNCATLFAMPALNEPWGIVYLEALACQTPILGLKRNSLPDITCQGKYGFLVNEPDPESIAGAIIQAFADPEGLKQMGALGQKYCLEKYSWSKVAKEIAKVVFDI